MSQQESRSRQITLVTGPASSGKSEWAERLAQGKQEEKEIVYVATAQVDFQDQEWQDRIAKHQARRPESWQTVHVPVELSTQIEASSSSCCLLVDSLGTWLTNLLDQEAEVWQQTQEALLFSLGETAAEVILVAEEVGWGVVPPYPLGRTFRDRLGKLVQEVGAIAGTVYLVAGGHALNLSQLGISLNGGGPTDD